MTPSLIVESVAARISGGLAAYKRGDFAETIRLLEHAASELGTPERLPPLALAAYALAVVTKDKRRTADSVRMCLFAIDRNPVDADLFHALVQVYLRAGAKRKAVQALQRGLRVDSQHKGLRECLDRLGRRASPCIPALGRGSLLNRILGRIRHALRRN